MLVNSHLEEREDEDEGLDFEKNNFRRGFERKSRKEEKFHGQIPSPSAKKHRAWQ